MTDRSTRKDNIEQIRLAIKDLEEILHASVRSQDKVHVLQFVAATRVVLGDLKVRNDKCSYSPVPIQSQIRKIRQEIRKRKSSVSRISRRPDYQYKPIQFPTKMANQDTLIHIAQKQQILQNLDCKVHVLQQALDHSQQKRRQIQRRSRDAQDLSEELKRKLGKLESAVDYQEKISVTNEKKLMQLQAKIIEQEKARDQIQARLSLALKQKLDLQAKNSELIFSQTRMASILDNADLKSVQLQSLKAKQISVQKQNQSVKRNNLQLKSELQKLRSQNRNLLLAKESLMKSSYQTQNNYLESLKRKQQDISQLQKQLLQAKGQREKGFKQKLEVQAFKQQINALLDTNSKIQGQRALLQQRLINKQLQLAASLKQLSYLEHQNQQKALIWKQNQDLINQTLQLQRKLKERQDQNSKIKLQLQQMSKYSKMVQSNYYQTKRENVSLLEQMQISKEFLSSMNEEKQRLSVEDSLLRQRLFQSEKARQKYKIKYLNSREGLQRLMQEKSKLQSIFREEFMAERDESLRLRSRQQQRLLSINSSFSQF